MARYGDKVTCRICHKKYDRITASHLKKHGTTIPEYRERFDLHYVSSARFRRAMSRLKRKAGTTGTYHVRNEKEIIRDLRRYDRRRSPLSWKWLWDHDATLAKQAVETFGCWSEAVKAAGIRECGRREWSIEAVLEAVRERAAAGEPMGTLAAKKGDIALHEAARRYLGTWKRAVKLSGVAVAQEHPGG